METKLPGKCQNCGAVLAIEDGRTKCAYCGTAYDKPETLTMQPAGKEGENASGINTGTNPAKKLLSVIFLLACVTIAFLAVLHKYSPQSFNFPSSPALETLKVATGDSLTYLPPLLDKKRIKCKEPDQEIVIKGATVKTEGGITRINVMFQSSKVIEQIIFDFWLYNKNGREVKIGAPNRMIYRPPGIDSINEINWRLTKAIPQATKVKIKLKQVENTDEVKDY